jgi:hypothetical protein
MYLGRHVVIIDFQLLGLKSDRKEGDSGDWNFKF